MNRYKYSDKEIELIKAKSDANMKYVASLIYESEYNIPDDEMLVVPEELDIKMRNFVSILSMQNETKKRRQSFATIGKRCAIFALVFAIAGSVSIISVDAWRLKAVEFFVQQGDGHFTLITNDKDSFSDWEGYYKFSKVPNGFELIYNNKDVLGKTIAYSNGETTITLEQYSRDTTISIDKEHSETVEVIVRDSKGFYTIHYSDGKESSNSLLWSEDNTFIQVGSNGDKLLSKQELLQLATTIKYYD